MSKGLIGPHGAVGTAVLGFGSARPARVVPNSDIVGLIDSTDEWIQQRSGIRTRRLAGDDETIESMGAEATAAAIAHARIPASEVDCLILATSTRVLSTPASAPKVATALGLTGIPAFDITAGCAGFCHGLTVASALIRDGSASHVAVLGTERVSDAMNFHDRATAFLFGDGAGAAIVGPSDHIGIGPTVWGSDGEKCNAIRQSKGWPEYFEDIEESGSEAVRPYLTMDGAEVFRWATGSLEPVCRKAIADAGLSPEDLDIFIPHQANLRIIEVLSLVLGLRSDCVIAKDIIEAGNTSAASVPMAIDSLYQQHSIRPGATALLVAFGAGLSFAAQVITMP